MGDSSKTVPTCSSSGTNDEVIGLAISANSARDLLFMTSCTETIIPSVRALETTCMAVMESPPFCRKARPRFTRSTTRLSTYPTTCCNVRSEVVVGLVVISVWLNPMIWLWVSSSTSRTQAETVLRSSLPEALSGMFCTTAQTLGTI